MKVLLVLSSHDRLGDTGEKTGYWYEEMAAPYYRLRDAGVEVVLASPKGGQPPMDPMSDEPDYQTDATHRFDGDAEAKQALANTVRLDSVTQDDFDAIFYAGGHGPLFDLAEDSVSIELIQRFWAAGKPVTSTCHGPAVFRHVVDETGAPLVQGKAVTGFTNSEEDAVHRTADVPFLLEDELKRLGGRYSKVGDFEPYVQQDGRLITGQNPNSAGGVADALLRLLQPRG